MKRSILVLLGLMVPFSSFAQTTAQPVMMSTMTTTTTISGLNSIDDEIAKLNKDIKKLQDERTKKDEDLNKCAKSVKGFKIAGISTLSATGVLGGVNIYQAVQRNKVGDKIEQETIIRQVIDALITRIVTQGYMTSADLRALYEYKDKLKASDIAKLKAVKLELRLTEEEMKNKSMYESWLREMGLFETVDIIETVEDETGASCKSIGSAIRAYGETTQQTPLSYTKEDCCDPLDVWTEKTDKNLNLIALKDNLYPRCERTLEGLKEDIEHLKNVGGRIDCTKTDMFPFTKEAQEWFDKDYCKNSGEEVDVKKK